MKKVFLLLVLVFSFSTFLVSCEPSDTAENDIYEQASDKDEEPDDEDPDA